MKTLRVALRQFHTDQRGQAFIIFAAALIPLLGVAALVMDVGQLYVKQRELQNAADAAALAGSALLPGSTASQRAAAMTLAEEFAGLNGVDPADLDISIETRDFPYDTVVAVPRETVEFNFARVLGLDESSVSVHAAAQTGSVAGGRGILPWGVEEPPSGFDFGDSYCLKLGSNGNGGGCSGSNQGNFHALDIDDNGNASANIYRNAIINGSTITVRVGDEKDVVPGNMQGPTSQGTGCSGSGGRIQGNNQDFDDVIETTADGYNVLDWDSPRIGLVPIVEFEDAHTASILAFGVFFIEGCGPNGSVSGIFIDTAVPGGEWAPFDEDTFFGARAARLVD